MIKNKIIELQNELKIFFLLKFDEKDFENSFLDFENSNNLLFNSIYSSFKKNLKSIISTASLPETMSKSRALFVIFNEILKRELILSAKLELDDDTVDDERLKREMQIKSKAYDDAHRLFFEEVKTENGKDEFWFLSFQFIKDLSEGQPFLEAAKELVNQSTLSLWTSFEVYCRDCFVALLNQQNDFVSKLLENPTLKQKFNLKNVPIEKLVEFNCDLSQNMGNVLIDTFEFSNLDIIKTIYKQFFQNEKLRKLLDNNDLWLLFKRRNLIVHKSGIVDKQYLETTNDILPLGSKLYITPEEFVIYLELVKEIAFEIKNEIKNKCA